MGKQYDDDQALLDSLENELNNILKQAKGPVERELKLSGRIRRQLRQAASREGKSLADIIAQHKQTYINAATEMATIPLEGMPDGNHKMIVDTARPILRS